MGLFRKINRLTGCYLKQNGGYRLKMSIDVIRRPDQVSPKTSPRGSRSPACPRQDSTGTLRTTISLGKVPSVIHTGPFYLVKDVPEEMKMTGSTNLMSYYGLEHTYTKFCGKKVKEELSAFMPNLPGNIDTPGIADNSSLRSLIEKPPIVGKEILPFTASSLAGFRLHAGPLPEQYRLMSQATTQKKKKKKRKHESIKEGASQEAPVGDTNPDQTHDRKHKRQKKGDEEKRKKKKDKKKKKKHSPDLNVSHSSEPGS